MPAIRSTLDKALSINTDPAIYGTFAEIGAGQEVARCFFLAGKASQTIAKTMSAYDMTFSDEIYGKEKSGRYVCESRLSKMLDKEFQLLHKRLDSVRGPRSKFFAFADTVATGDQSKKYSHGWLGIRFQSRPQGAANDIVMHVRILDKYRLQQQEVLGILGTNLVYAAFNDIQEQKRLISSLVENIKPGQVAIDFIRFSGPDLEHINNNLISLELVKRGLSEAVLFSPEQEIVDISDALFQKPLLVQRGLFHPVTNTHVEVLKYAEDYFTKDFKVDPMVLFELSMYQLEGGQKTDEQDFLNRVKSLCILGHYVLVSRFFLYYKLKRFLRSHTQAPLAMIVGAYHLDRLFDEKHYEDLDGGLLEGLGKLLDPKTKIYVYPNKTENSCTTAKTFLPTKKVSHIYRYFTELGQITDIAGCDEIKDYLHSDQVRELILKKDPQWEKCVPVPVKDLIKKEMFYTPRK